MEGVDRNGVFEEALTRLISYYLYSGGRMATQIAGFILRSNDCQRTTRFYAELGLVENQHQHGGPQHYVIGPLTDDCVAEVYTRSDRFPQDTLMLCVDSIDTALEIAGRYGIKPQTQLSKGSDMDFIYITDPDGRPVMLIQNKS